MTKLDFIGSPLDYFYGTKAHGIGHIPAEWVREAWEANAPFREDASAALANSIRKQGSLSFAGEWVGHLGSALTSTQAALLYETLRDGVDRSETEWRSEFEHRFPQCTGQLPPIDHVRIRRYFTLSLFFAMTGDLGELHRVLSDFHKAGLSLNDARLPVIEIMDVANFKCFDTSSDDDIWSVLQVAEAEGLGEITRLLREAGASE